jgi:ribosome-binding protein aMBF1 (putative translation factor)
MIVVGSPSSGQNPPNPARALQNASNCCIAARSIIAARHDAELTQQELADKLKRPQSDVSKYERGDLSVRN